MAACQTIGEDLITGLLILIFPLGITGYLAYRLRRSPLMALAPVLTLVMGQAIYIEKDYEWSVHVPGIPFPIGWLEVMFALLLGGWAWVRLCRPVAAPIDRELSWVTVASLVGLCAIQALLVMADIGRPALHVLFRQRQNLYLPLSIFIWLDIWRRVTKEDAWRLMVALACVAVPLAGLYALSSLGFPTYPITDPQRIEQHGEATVIRYSPTFAFWIPLSFAYMASRPWQTWRTGICLVVLFAAMSLSATRSYIIPAIAMTLVIVMYPVLRGEQIGKQLRSLFLIGAALGLFAIVLSTSRPDHAGFIVERVGELFENAPMEISNFSSRAQTFLDIAQYQARRDPILGAGATYGGFDETLRFAVGNQIVGDMLWSELIYRFGWSGVTLYVVMLAVYLIASFRVMKRSDSDRSRLGCILFCLVLWDILRTSASSDLLTIYPVGHAMILAMVCGLAGGLWRAQQLRTVTGWPLLITQSDRSLQPVGSTGRYYDIPRIYFRRER